MNALSPLRRLGVLALCAALFAAAAPPSVGFAAPALAARAGDEAPDAYATGLAELWIDTFMSPARMYQAFGQPSGLPDAWDRAAAESARDQAVAARPALIGFVARIMQTVGTPEERRAGLEFLSSPLGRRFLERAADVILNNAELRLSEADTAAIAKATRDNPRLAAFIDKMPAIDSGVNARMTELMTLFMPGMFARWGTRLEALPPPVFSAEDQLGGRIVAATLDVDALLKQVPHVIADAMAAGLRENGMPPDWLPVLEAEVAGVANSRRDLILVTIGRVYARHMSAAEMRATIAFFDTPEGREAGRYLRGQVGYADLKPAVQRAYEAFEATPAGRAFTAVNNATGDDFEKAGEEYGQIIMPTALRRFGERLLADNPAAVR